MKSNRLTKHLFFVVVVMTVTTGCNRTEESDSIVEITERMFRTQIEEIYLNSDDYLGKTIRLEGIFVGFLWNQSYSYFVYRFAAGGCCGTDQVGFEVKWPESLREPIPENNSWVQATGVLNYGVEETFVYLYLELTSLDVLTTRGMESVWR